MACYYCDVDTDFLGGSSHCPFNFRENTVFLSLLNYHVPIGKGKHRFV